MASNSKKPGVKALGRRALSLLMALVMSLSLVQISAFAMDDTVQKVDQVMKGVFVVDENNGTIKQNEDGTNQTTMDIARTQDGFTVSKQITEQLAENLFKVQLQVKTSQTIQTKDAAVLLVIDTSGSMDDCAFCGGDKKDHGNGFDHKNNCTNKSNTKSRLDATKEAINGTLNADGTKTVGFLDSLVNGNTNGGKIYVSVVKFAYGATKVCDWMDITEVNAQGELGNLNSVKGKVAGLSANGGTNLEAGLMLARNRLGMDEVKGAASKYTVLLTDGQPTYRNPNSTDPRYTSTESIPNSNTYDGDGSKCSKSEREQAVAMATQVKALSKLYTICYGAQGDEIKYTLCQNCGKTREEHHGRGNDRCYEYGQSKWKAGTTFTTNVGDFLKDEIATKDPDGKIQYAYNASKIDEVNKAFQGIASSSTEGMSGAGTKVIDPMGQYMQLVPQELSKELKQDGNTLTWTLGEAVAETKDNVTTYTYTVTYQVALVDLGTSDFKAGTYYPTNGATYLAIPDGNTTKNIYFNIPGVMGLRGSLDFEKVAHESDKGLMGAQFTLVNKANEALGVEAGRITINAQSGPDGKVEFKDIPSGYSYTLVETKAPNDYVLSSEYWTVTVAYGEVTVKDQDGKDVTESFQVVENTLDPDVKPITITKNWLAPTGTELPASITLNLMRKAEGSNADPVKVATIKAYENRAEIELVAGITDSITVKSASNWVYTVNAPSVDVETGAKWVYSVTEEEVSGYTSSVDGLRVTNTITGETSFTVTKEWILPADETAPEVNVTLSGSDGKTYGPVTLNKGNGWTYTWSELPMYNNKGEKITYSASEAPLGTGYTQDTEIPDANGTTFVNTVSNQTTEYAVTKTWNDGDGTGRPDSITVVLLRNGETFKSAELNAANNWSYEWTNLPVYTFTREDGTLKSVTKNVYTVEEVSVPGYNTTYGPNSITNTRTGVIDQLTATKVWDDGEYDFTHGNVTFKLYRSSNGIDFTYVAGEDRTVAETATWINLPQYDENGYAYTYKVVEEAVAGYDPSYSNDGIFVNGTVTVTNTLMDLGDKTEVVVNKTWLGEAAEDVTFYLYQNKQGETVGAEQDLYRTETLKEGDTYLTFKDLPKQYWEQNAEGELVAEDYVYTVVEAEGQNFKQDSYTKSDDGLTWSFTNLNTETTSFTVNKVWKDLDATQRGEAEITLYRRVNGQQDPNFAESWTVDGDSHTFTGLAKYDSEGNPYTYYVLETKVPAGYTSSVSNEGHTVTNTLNQAYINKVIQKVWVDGGKDNENRPDIKVNLLRDGKTIATVTVKSNGDFEATKGYTVVVDTTKNPWVITFKDLPKYDDERIAEYVYTVSEEPVEGYQTTVNGDTITNTLPQPEANYTLTKYWVDGNDENGTRPDELVFELTATANGKTVASVDGKDIPSTVKLTKADVEKDHPNTWSTKLDLPSLDNDRYPISYTLKEVVPAGYTSETLASTGNDFQFRNTLTQDNSISVTANKVWNNSYEGFLTNEQKPVDVDSIFVGLYRKSGTNDNGFTLVDGSIQQMTKAGEWTVTWNSLPKYDSNGFAYQYQVFEGSYTTDGDGKQAWIRAESTISFNGRTYEVGYKTEGNNTTITNTFKAPVQYYYTVVGNYTTYVDGKLAAHEENVPLLKEGIIGLTEITDVTVDAMQYVDRNGATFKYTGGSLQVGAEKVKDFDDVEVTVTVDEANKLYTITLNYERRTNTPYTPSTSYTVTVNYYDIDTGAVIHQNYQTSGTAYSSYDVTVRDKIAIEGYTYVKTTGDDLKGILNGNKVIDVYYTKDADIDDPDTPTDPGTDIGDDDVPVTPAKPPKTGDSMGLWAAAAMVSGVGLVWLSLSGKKRREEA